MSVNLHQNILVQLQIVRTTFAPLLIYYRMGKTFFWQICGSVNCTWEWVFFGIALVVTAFAMTVLIQTFRYHKKFVFQLIPLSMNVFSMFLLNILHILIKNFQFHFAAYQIEIYTYFLFCYSFITLYLSGSLGKKKCVKIASNIVFGLVSLITIMLVCFVFAGKLSANCNTNFMATFYAFFSAECVFYLLTMYFGILVLLQIRKPTESIKATGSGEDGDQYAKKRVKQIILILSAYTLSILLRILWAILYQTQSATSITCTYASDAAYVLESINPTGQFIIIMNEITQVIPHLLLPVALYTIPSSSFKKGDKIDLSEGLIENPEIDENQGDSARSFLKSQLSSVFGSQ